MAHKPAEQLAAERDQAIANVPNGSVWSHYKQPDRHYHVIELGFLEATDEVCVIYQQLYGEALSSSARSRPGLMQLSGKAKPSPAGN